MTVPIERQPQRVVLSARTWRDEIQYELVKLGMRQDRAERSSVAILQRILSRARWPSEAFRVAPGDGPAYRPVDELEELLT